MLTVDFQSWGQTPEQLRQQALNANHPRSRERFMSLYEVSKGSSATGVGHSTGRNPQTVMKWVHRYNTCGPDALVYRHTGGHPPLCLSKLYQP